MVEVTNSKGEKVYDENGEVKVSDDFVEKEVNETVTEQEKEEVKRNNESTIEKEIISWKTSTAL